MRTHTTKAGPPTTDLSAEELTAMGYRKTSNQYGIVSRIDRPDWLDVLAATLGGARANFIDFRTQQVDGRWCDYYRRVLSKDKHTVTPGVLAGISTSSFDTTGYVELDKHLAECHGLKLPMREKYVDEAVGVWFLFGSRADGSVDISDGRRDVFEGLPKEAAEAIVLAQQNFRDELYKVLCGADNIPLSEQVGLLTDMLSQLMNQLVDGGWVDAQGHKLENNAVFRAVCLSIVGKVVAQPQDGKVG